MSLLEVKRNGRKWRSVTRDGSVLVQSDALGLDQTMQGGPIYGGCCVVEIRGGVRVVL